MSVDDQQPFQEVVSEITTDRCHGDIVGCCKWFNKKLGYGFITVYTGEHKGSNIFIHHTGIHPLNSNFNTLRKGEYISMDIINGTNGIQGINVKGVCGGPLMCDNSDINNTNHTNNTNNTNNTNHTNSTRYFTRPVCVPRASNSN